MWPVQDTSVPIPLMHQPSRGIADEVVICDVKEKKLESERQDLFDTGVFCPHRVRVTAGSYEDLTGCDIIINAAGKVDLLIGSSDRTKELKYTVPQTRIWAKEVKAAGFKGIVINVSNPCDVVTREIAEILKLPEGNVFGTGTGLDTASELPLTEEEKEKFHACAESIRKKMDTADHLA